MRTSEGIQIPVGEVASIELVSGPLQINRDATKRRIVIGVNVRDADIQQVVANIQKTLDKNIKLQPGYYFEYGGQFENLQNAINTLMIVIPVALMLILLILFFSSTNTTDGLWSFASSGSYCPYAMIMILSPVLTQRAAAPFKQIMPLPRSPQIV